MKCKNCNSPAFRISRLRSTDFLRLLFLQYPVRCRHCHARSFIDFLRAYGIQRARKLSRQDLRRPLSL
jgi:hypothetical protein